MLNDSKYRKSLAGWFGPTALASLLAAAAPASAGVENAVPQQSAPAPQESGSPLAAPRPQTSDKPVLALAATFGGGQAIRSGLHWRIFSAQAGADGAYALVAQSTEAHPTLPLSPGDYVVHATYGLAGASQSVTVPATGAASVRIALTAGALRVVGMLGSALIPPERLSIDIYVPQPGNSEAKLVVKGERPGEAIGLPEGFYHIVSTYLDTVGVGSLNASSSRGIPTNSVVSADLKVQTGKVTDAVFRHRAAVLTLKLVNAPHGEALANTSFTVLTPGGDVIRELVGAFPSLVLAEGDYVVIARWNGRTFQSNFSVESSVDRDIEIVAK